MIHHTELSHFRTGLRFRQVMNIFVYILHYFYQSGCLEKTVIHGIDSTELPAEINYPLCTVKIKGKKFVSIQTLTVIVENVETKETSPVMLSDINFIH